MSQRRAGTVRRYLMAKGIAGKRLVARGYGMTRPIVLPRGPNAHKNRRVEFVIISTGYDPKTGSCGRP